MKRLLPLLLVLLMLASLVACNFNNGQGNATTDPLGSALGTENDPFTEKHPDEIPLPEGSPLGHFMFFPDAPAITDSTVGVSQREKNEAKQWFSSLIASADKLPFSFTLGEKTYHGFNSDFTVKKEDGAIVGVHKDSGLTVSFRYAFEEAYARAEWTLHFEHTGSHTSPVIRDVRVMNLELTLSDPKLSYYTVYPTDRNGILGANEAVLRPGTDLTFRPATGDGGSPLPFYDLRAKSQGFLIALGWQGHWETAFSADFISVSSVGLTASAGQALLATALEPGETLIAPQISVFPYSDLTAGHSADIFARWYADRVAASTADTALSLPEPYAASLSTDPFAPWQTETESDARIGMAENRYVRALYDTYATSIANGYLPIDSTAFSRLDLYLIHLPLRLALGE